MPQQLGYRLNHSSYLCLWTLTPSQLFSVQYLFKTAAVVTLNRCCSLSVNCIKINSCMTSIETVHYYRPLLQLLPTTVALWGNPHDVKMSADFQTRSRQVWLSLIPKWLLWLESKLSNCWHTHTYTIKLENVLPPFRTPMYTPLLLCTPSNRRVCMHICRATYIFCSSVRYSDPHRVLTCHRRYSWLCMKVLCQL